MSATVDFYLSRAAESAKAARESDLVNVKERCLRAEAAWQAMADRLIRVEAQKQHDALEKERRLDEAGMG
ncbi:MULTISPECIES: hypothetical protein [Sphingobium]|uniref:Uncharacterized protein n=1 Tax=Sphingobium lignivorans TaxID=2735886 RepID=A0ABR6NIZ0_9SPHN|nr:MULTISPECIES: hypothetical protein [Sphingobium]MBB5987081.1 hypothetical protein [Sphingobium lignivorans]BAK67767.1 hypothetical protein SLG_30920 [Sphingobium sp. SYK-6]